MDSISQIVLGASIAHLTLGEKLGRRALLVGAVVATLPDLDVLVPYDDAIESFTYHRSWSHSLLVLSLFSTLVAWFLQKVCRSTSIPYSRWLLGMWLVLITHPLLDGFTVYGTQLAWPLNVPPTAWGSVFIIDPIYSLPLIIGVFVACRRSWANARSTLVAGLAISTMYLGWTLVAQHSTRHKIEATLEANSIQANHILVAPFPFSLLWRVVVVTDEHYMEGYSSLLDSDASIVMDTYSNGKSSCQLWLTHPPVMRMDWFTRGAFALSVKDNVLVLSDLRMGIEDDYVFEFAIADWRNDAWQPVVTRLMPLNIDAARMTLLLHRVVDESVDLTPLARLRGVPQEGCAGMQQK